jgi:hypothetical protein
MDSGKTWADNLTISPVIEQANKLILDDLSLNSSKINANGPMFYEKPIPIRKDK